ncbi:MAG: glycosyltransferase 87 family protein [Thermoplasmatota archaeon]
MGAPDIPVIDRGRSEGTWTSLIDRKLVISFLVYLLLLGSMAVFGRYWNTYKAFYGPWFISFVFFMYFLLKSEIIRYFDDAKPWKVMLFLFLLTAALHIPFLVQSPSMSQDILRMERRGEDFVSGKFPYRDFAVNKPPMYIWMVGVLSFPFGPHNISYRIFFTLMSALVPVAMYGVYHRLKNRPAKDDEGPFGIGFPNMTWAGAAFAYALCPIPILETGMAGHFDPVVVLNTVVAFYFLVRERPFMSGAFLGMGFALKLYPLFMVPLFFLAFRKWKERILFVIGFITIPILASLPILLVDPILISRYLRYQFVSWYTGFSIRYGLEWLLDSLSLSTRIAYIVMTALLGAGCLYYYLRGMFGRPRKMDSAPLVVLLFLITTMGIALSTVFYAVDADSVWDWLFGVIGTLISIVIPVLGLYIFMHWHYDGHPLLKGLNIKGLFISRIRKRDVPFYTSLILILLVLTSAQFHPWYLTWILPFAMASGIPYWGWTVLFFFSSLQSNAYPPWELGRI